MSVVASVLSLVLFVAFGSAGLQKLVFNPAASRISDHLGFTKRAYQRVGGLEVVASIAVLVGLASSRTTFLGILNVVAAGALVILMIAALSVHLRKGDAFKYYAPALALGVVALVEVIARLV